MAINRLWNSRCGPGGGTRRLHQHLIENLWGRNRIDVRNKDTRFARYSTTVIGLNIIRGNVSSSSTGKRQTRLANRNRRVANSNRTRRVAKAA